MATFAQRRAALLLETEQRLTADFRQLADRIRMLLNARADREGRISPADWSRLDSDIGALILGYLLGGVTAAPFRVRADATFEALSEYARRYEAAVYLMTVLALEQQAAQLRRQYPAELERRLRNARFSPFDLVDSLPTQKQTLFRNFVPQYAVVRADNRALLDRMIAAAGETRRKLSLLLREQLGAGVPARDIGDTIERFMTVGLNTANQPYGTKGIFDSLRLLLSEAVFAYNRAAVMAAALNPQTKWVEVFTSPRHHEIDGCDEQVAGNPYTVEACPVPPFHAYCQCGLRFVYNRTTEASITALRESGMLDIKGALSPDFAQILLRGGDD